MGTAPLFEDVETVPQSVQAPKRPLPTLIEAEEWLQELVDTAGAATPDQEAKLGLVIQEALSVAVDKRQKVAEAILHYEEQAAFAKSYGNQILERGRRFAKVAEGIRAWVLRYIEGLPLVEAGRRAGKLPMLEGHTLKMSAAAIADRVEYPSPGSVPLDYQNVTVTMPAKSWIQIRRIVSEAAADQKLVEFVESAETPYTIDGPAVKKALQEWYPFRDHPCLGGCKEGKMPAGRPCPKCNGRGKIRRDSPVPGAELITGCHTLKVR